MNSRRVRKAVFPVGGLGTRFLPATKASPKEMLSVVDKPLIQYAAEEAVAAGIDTLIFVTGRNKRSIPDHFDKAYELEAELAARGKTETLELVRDVVPPHVTCVYIRQTEALGLGHAVLCAAPVVGNDPFAVLLADDLIDGGDKPCLVQMCELFEFEGNSLLAVEQVPPDQTRRYGMVKVEDAGRASSRVLEIVEKPAPEQAPSNLGVVGRYVLTPRILGLLAETPPGSGDEIQLTDAIGRLLAEERVDAYRFSGRRYDCGSKFGYLQANIDFALQHPEIGDEMRQYLKLKAAELG